MLDLQILLEEELEEAREKEEQAAFDAERKAAEAAAAQKAKEAHYKQEGDYDRSKDPRNDLEEGLKTETPSYKQLLLQGRKKRTEYKGKKVIRALSYEELRASENFHRRGIAFGASTRRRRSRRGAPRPRAAARAGAGPG